MNSADEYKAGIKKKIIHETRDMLLIFLYLALFFCSFTTYRGLVSNEFGISAFNYGFALVKALVLATGYLKGDGINVSCVPEFADVTIEDKVRTAIKLVVEPQD
jgi:hypothetical protein